jgi:hypothetical protein
MAKHNVTMILRNVADLATLTATPAMETTLDVGNVQNQERSRVARTTSLDPQSIKGDMPVAYPVYSHGFAIIGSFTGTALIRIRLWEATGQTGTLVYDSGEVEAIPLIGWGEFNWGETPWGGTANTEGLDPFYFRFFDDVEVDSAVYQSFQIDVTDTLNPAGYIDFRRLFMGRALTPKINADYGLAWSLQDDTIQEIDEAGGIKSHPRPMYRTLSFSLSHLDQGERSLFSNDFRYCGLTHDIFICVKPQGTGQEYFDLDMPAKFTTAPEYTQPYLATWVTQYQIREV